jgi:hypothetical protein
MQPALTISIHLRTQTPCKTLPKMLVPEPAIHRAESAHLQRYRHLVSDHPQAGKHSDICCSALLRNMSGCRAIFRTPDGEFPISIASDSQILQHDCCCCRCCAHLRTECRYETLTAGARTTLERSQAARRTLVLDHPAAFAQYRIDSRP